MPIETNRAPLYEMLEKHAGLQVHSFHVPGHKQRSSWQYAQADQRYGPLLPLDVTELPDTDDLHHAYGAIKEAEQLAADCFGADETRFLIGGSTAGNLAMILGVCSPGDLLIIQRNVHRSVIHGLMLAGVRAVFLPPAVDPVSGLAVIPDAVIIERAVTRHAEARGVLLCSPNYYGMTGDLNSVVQVCHSVGVPVLIDEAHGPHFGFHPSFPTSALLAGADIVVQSAHKMLSAMTMGAMLHFQGDLIDREPVREALRMVQSSSPSFPILASLDLSRRQLHQQGTAAFEPALQAVCTVREGLQHTTFRAIGQAHDRLSQIVQDPLKLVLYEASGRWDGFRLRDELTNRGCVAEMADARYTVLAFGIGSCQQDGEALIRTLSDLYEQFFSEIRSSDKIPGDESTKTATASGASIPEPVTLSRHFPDTVVIPLEESAGRMAGEWIVPYPPGIPEIFPGELITEAVVERLKSWRRQGALIQGAEDPGLVHIRVRHT
jgi:arginine decarboxylase